jgi:hypothetical protein
MRLAFTLCPECLARYGALRFDPTAHYGLCGIPLCSLVWPDEHPGDAVVEDFDGTHRPCRDSIIRLAGARSHLWRSGKVPEGLRDLWDTARRLVPDWPGFRRLSLNRAQLESLEACLDELADFLQAVRQEYPDVTITDEGGGLRRFTAKRSTEPPLG